MVLLVLADNANDQGSCWPSIPTIARKSGLSERAVQYRLKELEQATFVEREDRNGHSSVYKLVLWNPTAETAPVQGMHQGGANGAPPGVQTVHPEPSVESPRNHHIGAEPQVSPKSQMKAFKPPSIEEVRLLIAKTALPESEADKFWNFYESKGWMVGKNRMRQVASAVANWAAHYREWNPTYLTAEQIKISGSERMVYLEELKRVEAKMKSIRDSYAEHQTWSKQDTEKLRQLRARRDELKKLLGMQV